MNDLKEPKQEKKNELSTPLDVSKSSENKPASSDGNAYEVINNTPFYAGKLTNGKWAIGCGNHRASMEFETAEEAVKFVKKQAKVLELIGMYTEEAIQYALKLENQKHNL